MSFRTSSWDSQSWGNELFFFQVAVRVVVWGNCWKDKCELSRFVLCEWALTRPASLAEESAVKGGILQQERNSRNEEVRRPKISPLLLLKTSGLFCFLFFGCFVLFLYITKLEKISQRVCVGNKKEQVEFQDPVPYFLFGCSILSYMCMFVYMQIP